MKRLFFLLALFTVLTTQAQTLKTYKGEMNGETGMGNITYTYFEDSNGNELRHGNFKYVEKTSKDGGSYVATFTGNYKNGFKDGTWNYVIERNDHPNTNGFYITSTLKMSISYKDGMPNGSWNYSMNGKRRKRLRVVGGWTWGAYENIPSETIQVNFKNGALTGNVRMKTPYVDVTGQVNEQGFWVGKWLLDGQADECLLENGILKRRVVRNDGGQIALNTNYDDKLLELQEQFRNLPIEQQKDFAIQHRLKIDTISGIKYYNINDSYFNHRMFKHRETAGDKTSVSDEHGNLYDKKDYGRFVNIEYVKLIPLARVLSGLNLNSRNYIEHERLEALLEQWRIQLSDEDISEFEKIISERKSMNQAEKENKEYGVHCEKLYAQLMDLVQQPKEPTKATNTSNQSKIHDLDEILNPIFRSKNIYKPHLKFYENDNYKITDFSKYGYNPDYKPTASSESKFVPIVSNKESYDKLNEYIDFIKTKQADKDSINNLSNLISEINVNAYKVDNAYVTNLKDMGMNGWTKYNPKKVRKPKLYNPYFETLAYLASNLKLNVPFNEYYNSINEINNLCLFMSNNIKGKTSDIEKELSGTDKVENWVEIFRKYIK